MGLLTDPVIGGRGDTGNAGGTPNAYAEDSLGYTARGQARSASERDAYAAMSAKAPYAKAPIAPTFQQRWSVWAAGFGGTQNTGGDTRVLGSNDTRSSIYGTAVGADYRFSPNTIAGFALAGGGTSFNVNGLGSGPLRPVPGRRVRPPHRRPGLHGQARWPMAGRTSRPIAR